MGISCYCCVVCVWDLFCGGFSLAIVWLYLLFACGFVLFVLHDSRFLGVVCLSAVVYFG